MSPQTPQRTSRNIIVSILDSFALAVLRQAEVTIAGFNFIISVNACLRNLNYLIGYKISINHSRDFQVS